MMADKFHYIPATTLCRTAISSFRFRTSASAAADDTAPAAAAALFSPVFSFCMVTLASVYIRQNTLLCASDALLSPVFSFCMVTHGNTSICIHKTEHLIMCCSRTVLTVFSFYMVTLASVYIRQNTSLCVAVALLSPVFAGGQSWPWQLNLWVSPLFINNLHTKWLGKKCSLYRAHKISQQNPKVDLWPNDPKTIGFLLSSSTTCMWSLKVIGQKLVVCIMPTRFYTQTVKVDRDVWPRTQIW